MGVTQFRLRTNRTIHLHHFIIHGKKYGINQPGATVFDDRASDVKLASFGWRLKEKFLYEYDFSMCPSMGTWRYWWRHLLRVEALKTEDSKQIYPVCTAGKGFCPPENCGGPWGFMKTKEEFFISDVLERLVSILRDDNAEIDREEVREMFIWLSVYQNRFDRIRVNKHLRQYATGDRKSLFFEQVIV